MTCLEMTVLCVCASVFVSMLPVSVFECRDPQSSARAKGPSSISQGPSANHFLRIGGLKKKWQGRKEAETEE